MTEPPEPRAVMLNGMVIVRAANSDSELLAESTAAVWSAADSAVALSQI